VVWLLSRGSDAAREREEARLREEGFDSILDDPRTFNALLSCRTGFSTASQPLVFYVLVRHTLLERGITDRTLADYITALLLDPPVENKYLVDLKLKAETAMSTEGAFLMNVKLGEVALWLSGLFPDHITARVQRRGAPPIGYYERMGASGFRTAADFTAANRTGMKHVYEHAADVFPDLRIALNSIADRHLFPARGSSIERLLRQVSDSFHFDAPGH
jgi:hypothetical protein